VLPILKEVAPEKAASILQGLQNLINLNQERVGLFMPSGIMLR
jgi:hypothetical protein